MVPADGYATPGGCGRTGSQRIASLALLTGRAWRDSGRPATGRTDGLLGGEPRRGESGFGARRQRPATIVVPPIPLRFELRLTGQLALATARSHDVGGAAGAQIRKLRLAHALVIRGQWRVKQTLGRSLDRGVRAACLTQR